MLEAQESADGANSFLLRITLSRYIQFLVVRVVTNSFKDAYFVLLQYQQSSTAAHLEFPVRDFYFLFLLFQLPPSYLFQGCYVPLKKYSLLYKRDKLV